MKTLILSAMVCAAAVTGLAQGDYSSLRVAQSADQLKRTTTRLAQDTMQNVVRSADNSRSEIQSALLAQQIDASATLLVEMIRNRRPGRELRDVVFELRDLSRRAPSFSPQNAIWRQVQSGVADLDGELAIGPGRGPMPGPPERPIIGRVSWRGRVDDRVQLAIRGNSIEVRTISGSPNPDGVANFTSPLPNRPVDVGVTKNSGRGAIKILQQPSRANDFTAVIEIYDNVSGAQEYRLDIFWR